MIVNETESRNFSAVSAIDVANGQGTPIIYMNASYDRNNGLSFQKNIRDMTLYKENRDACDSDWETFQKNVEKSILE